jgi:hypothetical protein
MADMMNILSSNYLTVGSTLSSYSNSKYVNVDPASYEGTWTGKYGDGKSFTVQISNVTGFRARVKYQSGSTTNYGEVLIKDSSFRVGDSKFVLAAEGTAVMSTVITDSYTGATTVKRAYAKQG